MGNLLVFGDSVTWGQGHIKEHKYAEIVAAALKHDIHMHAHSGATIGVGDSGTGSCPSEAPRPTPTILQQVLAVPSTPEPDVVLISGGINDVSVQYMLSPLTSTQGLIGKVERHCFHDMVTLLRVLLDKYKNLKTRFAVTSYFPVFSKESDFGNVLNYLTYGLFIAPPPAFAAREDRELFALRSVELALLFWNESNKQLKAAVECIGSSQVVYVQVPFTERNSMFAPEPWLFNVHLDGLVLKAEDPMAGSRKADCKECHPANPFARETCKIASAGHPNVNGANQYAKAILKALDA